MKRIREHRNVQPTNVTYCANWIRQLQSKGLDFIVAVLDYCEVQDECATERWWILYGRACGWPLTNLTDGGDGLSGYTKSDKYQTKINQTLQGHSVSKETRARQRAAKLTAAEQLRLRGAANPARSVEARAKISKSKREPSLLEALRVRMANRVVSIETRRRLSASMRLSIARRREHARTT